MTIFGIPTKQLVPVANFIGLGFLRLLAIFELRFRRSNATPAERQGKVAGAAIDNTAVKQLASAIEAHTQEAMTQRLEAEKQRQGLYRLIDVANRIVEELAELRHEIGDLAKEVDKRK